MSSRQSAVGSRQCLGLRPSRGARRAAPGAEAGPLPAQPPRLPTPAPSLPHQKLTLYAGGALVLLILLVIVLFTPRASQRPLALVPEGQTSVQVIDISRLLRSPVYQAVRAADHPIARENDKIEEEFALNLERDVSVVVDTDDATVLIGRFRISRIRDSFEELIELEEKRISRSRPAPVKLELREGDVEGYKYLYCNQEGVDRAFATIGSSIVCFGDRWGVRRILKARAGVRGPVLDDDAFAAAYSSALAGGAMLYRLEKPGGKLLSSKLKEVLGAAGDGVRAAFFAVGASKKAVGLTIRLVCRDAKAAEELELQLGKASTQVALRPLLSADASLRVSRGGALVVLESAIPLDGFDEIVEKDKRGLVSNLILAMMAN